MFRASLQHRAAQTDGLRVLVCVAVLTCWCVDAAFASVHLCLLLSVTRCVSLTGHLQDVFPSLDSLMSSLLLQRLTCSIHIGPLTAAHRDRLLFIYNKMIIFMIDYLQIIYTIN